MSDALAEAKYRLAIETTDVAVEPLHADRWIVSSLLQKAVRRGDVEIAQRAALTFYQHKKSDLWRRLMIIAFEDVGAGSPDVVAMTVAAGSDPAFRKQCGGDVAVALRLARLLAEASKDRSADYLICGAETHPWLETARRELESQSPEQRLSVVADVKMDLRHRAAAAWYASGIEGGREERVGKGDMPALLETFRRLAVPEQLVAATGIAAKRTRNSITIMVPLVWLAAHRGEPPTVAEFPVPATATVDDIPMYALDKHTRVGREAIARFGRRNDAVRAALERHVPADRHRNAVLMATFYADAAPVSKRLMWDGSLPLEAFGTETDFLKVGVPVEAHDPLLCAVRANLDHLNAIRAATFRARALRTGPDQRGDRRSEVDGEPTFFRVLDRK